MKKILVLFIYGLFTILVILIFIPTIISNSYVNKFIIKTTNKFFDGDIQIKSIDAGWRKGIYLKGINCNLTNLTFSAEDLFFEADLLSVLFKKSVQKSFTLKSWQINSFIPNNISSLNANNFLEKKNLNIVKITYKVLLTLLINTKIQVENGNLSIASEDMDTSFKNINSFFLIKDLRQNIECNFSAFQEKTGGHIFLKSSINPFRNKKIDLGTIRGNVDVDIKNLKIKPIYIFLNSIHSFPLFFSEKVSSIDGLLNINVKNEFKNLHSFDVRGFLRIESLEIEGKLFKNGISKTGDIVIDFEALISNEKIDITKINLTSKFLNLNGKLNQSMMFEFPLFESSLHAEINIENLFSFFPFLIDLKQGVSIQSGDLKIDLKTYIKTNKFHFDNKFFLEKITINDNKKVISLDEPLNFSANGSIVDSKIFFDELVIKVISASIKGNGSLNSFKCKLSLDINKFLNECKKIIDINLIELKGIYEGNIILNKSENNKWNAEIDSFLADFQFKKDAFIFNDSKIKILSNLYFDGNDLNIDIFLLDSKLLTLKSNGKINNIFLSPLVGFKGSFVLDSSYISELLTNVFDSKIAIKISQSSDFIFQIKQDKNIKEIFKKLFLKSDLKIDEFDMFGVKANDFSMKTQCDNGRVTISLQTKALNGFIDVNSFIDFINVYPKFTITENSTILNNMDFSTEMASRLIAKIHPILDKSVVSSGKINLTIKNCSLLLDNAIRKNMSIQGKMELKDTIFKPEGILKDILKLGKYDEKEALLPNQTIEFSCENGNVISSPLTIIANTYKIIISGSINSDNSINYDALIPVNEKMVSGDAYKYLKDSTIKVLIKGTTEKPYISSESFTKSLDELVREGLKKAISERGTEFINDFLKKI